MSSVYEKTSQRKGKERREELLGSLKESVVDEGYLERDRVKNCSLSSIEQSNYDITHELGIEDFEVFTTVGTGTFGRVRQVRIKEDPTGTIYALKMLKKTEIVRLNQVDHIKSEKSILNGVRHPFIVRL